MITAYPARRSGGYLMETFKGPRAEARAFARQYLDRFPKGGYMTAVDAWKVVEEGKAEDHDIVEFTMRRLPSAD